jgi:Xaa-Pro aminopeptidase
VLFAEVDGRRAVLTSWLERDRVTRALPDAEVLDFFDFGWKDLVAGGMSFAEADRETVARVVRRIGIDEAIVPGDFPLALGDHLRDGGIVLTVDGAAVELRRRAKSVVELDGIRAAQRAAEAGMTTARGLLARSRPTDDGRLQLDGKPLLADDVRGELFDLTCDLFESEGRLTQRTARGEAESEEEGFQSWLGHGVGLDVHESPGLGPGGRDALVAGDVLAIEPVLWNPRIGEVRFEDLVLVTEDGCETLTRFPYDLAPST